MLMINIGITGSDGLIGYHLRVLLSNKDDINVNLANRETFASSQSLIDFTNDLDVIVHLADKNVGADKDLREINMSISKKQSRAARQRPHGFAGAHCTSEFMILTFIFDKVELLQKF